jgi:hypothetical protein
MISFKYLGAVNSNGAIKLICPNMDYNNIETNNTITISFYSRVIAISCAKGK